jgi:hypothetical protein
MPTIDDLPAATSVSDTDELVVSQSDIARKATRTQLLSGVQSALALTTGTLLGRVSAGLGSPEAITIGANLSLANGTLNAPPAFVIANLSAGGSPGASDLVPLGQGGQNATVSFATFAAGLAAIPGLDDSSAVAAPTGGVGMRRLADLFSDAISVESFGAVGDGVTDDTAAFNAAVASGRPVRLDGRTYIVNGSLSIQSDTAIIGVASQTIVQRASVPTSGNWINVGASSFWAIGVTFNAGNLTASNCAAISVNSSCTAGDFIDCQFLGAVGLGVGHGLLIDASNSASISISGCQFVGNAGDGLHVVEAGLITIDDCVAQSNGGYGITVSGGVQCAIRNSQCNHNKIGISVGSWQAAASTGGTVAPCNVTGNWCENNALWGMAIAGTAISICGNMASSNGAVAGGGGILVRATSARIVGNGSDGGAFGIDARTCINFTISGNYLSNATTGVAVGAGRNGVVEANFLCQNGWGVSCNAFEPSLSSSPTGPVSIDRNWIGITSALSGGISLADGVQGISVTGNDINGWGSAGPGQALWLHTDTVICAGNRWNNTAQYDVSATTVAGQSALVFPDTADDVLVISAPPNVGAVLSVHQVATMGQIVFIRVTAGGQGYTQAEVTIGGSGSGAATSAICTNGSVLGFVMTNPGSGYGPIGTMAPVTITGDGSGATATAYVGLPVPTGRSLRLVCACPLRLTLAGSAPAQENWTQYNLSVPAYGAVDLVGAFGGWYAVQSPPVDYLAPTGDGGAVLQSVGGGDLVLRPSSGGALCLSNQAEPLGCTSSVGRGSPAGTVAAPPGSDFRNLNGGTGNTFWIKCSGTDSSGWVAVA